MRKRTIDPNTGATHLEPLSDCQWTMRGIRASLGVAVSHKKNTYQDVPTPVIPVVLSSRGILHSDAKKWLDTYPVHMRHAIQRQWSFRLLRFNIRAIQSGSSRLLCRLAVNA